ncbi:MAG: EscU/YscU/HrcU family type III secretion system export apparatus switch protein [Planctomycetaceae bacterium]|jgi:flagellar biosynthetic protein FlhB|nr:EscU/YscU/HrcU family type III secretion system export apparatus switch protein [Planctomycetaceae bacterium]
MAGEGGDKTHEATPRRREQAREQGQVAKSQDLAAALVLLFAIILLMTLGKQIAEHFANYSQTMLSDPLFLIPENAEKDGLNQSVMNEFYKMVLSFLQPVGIFFLSLLAVAVLANLAQIGFLWLPDKLGFDFTRLDPIKGFGRIFSMQSVMRLLMGIVKIVICALVAYYAVCGEIGTILNLTENDENQISNYLVQTLLMIALKVAVALVIIAILDYMYQKWKFEQDLRMSNEEMREEMKNMLGDPQVLGKRRQIQREMAMKQRGGVQGTSDADVVVTNPTHYAVALKFDPETMDVPIVVAKGADFLAQQIRKIALEHGIPIIEKKLLAQALFKTVEIGQPVRETEHLIALAEILAYAYRLSGRNIEEELRRLRQHAA